MKPSVKIPLLILSFGLLISCSKKSDDKPTQKSLPVEKLEAQVEHTGIDTRSDWKLVLHRSYYTYNINGATISGTSGSTPHSFLLGDGDLVPLLPDEEPGIFFFSTGYVNGPEFLVVKDGPPAFPNIRDQSTLNDLVKADMLFGKYAGIPAKNLSNIQLTDANALLDFEVEGLPAGAVLKLVDLGRQFLPFQHTTNHYQAIVTGKWHSLVNPSISVKIAGKEYTADIISNADLKGNTRYKFKVKLDNEQLLIENLTTTTWGAAQWPDM